MLVAVVVAGIALHGSTQLNGVDLHNRAAGAANDLIVFVAGHLVVNGISTCIRVGRNVVGRIISAVLGVFYRQTSGCVHGNTVLFAIVGAGVTGRSNLLGDLVDLILYRCYCTGIKGAVNGRTILSGIGRCVIDRHIVAGRIFLVVADRISAIIIATGAQGICYGSLLCTAIVVDIACGNGQATTVLIVFAGTCGANAGRGDLVAARRQFPAVVMLFSAADTLLGRVIITVVFF